MFTHLLLFTSNNIQCTSNISFTTIDSLLNDIKTNTNIDVNDIKTKITTIKMDFLNGKEKFQDLKENIKSFGGLDLIEKQITTNGNLIASNNEIIESNNQKIAELSIHKQNDDTYKEISKCVLACAKNTTELKCTNIEISVCREMQQYFKGKINSLNGQITNLDAEITEYTGLLNTETQKRDDLQTALDSQNYVIEGVTYTEQDIENYLAQATQLVKYYQKHVDDYTEQKQKTTKVLDTTQQLSNKNDDELKELQQKQTDLNSKATELDANLKAAQEKLDTSVTGYIPKKTCDIFTEQLTKENTRLTNENTALKKKNNELTTIQTKGKELEGELKAFFGKLEELLSKVKNVLKQITDDIIINDINHIIDCIKNEINELVLNLKVLIKQKFVNLENKTNKNSITISYRYSGL